MMGFVVVVLLSYHCSRIYVKIFSHPQLFTRPSYPQLGWIVFGSPAYFLILVFSVCECVGTACVYILFLWNNLYYLLCRFQLYSMDGFVGQPQPGGKRYRADGEVWSSSLNQISEVCVCLVTLLPSVLILRVSRAN